MLWYKNLSKNYVWSVKKIVYMYLEIGNFCPASTASNALTGTWINKDPFTKKIALPIIFHMPHWWPMYLFWGLSNSIFRAGLFSTVSAQTGLNWFLLSFQTAKSSDKNRYCCFHHQGFLDQIFILALIWWCLPRWRTHGGRHKC